MSYGSCGLFHLSKCVAVSLQFSTKTVWAGGGGGKFPWNPTYPQAIESQVRWSKGAGFRWIFDWGKWWEAQLEYRAWTGICYIAKDIMCRLQKLLADKDTSSCDIPHSDDNEELVENDSMLIIYELWILRKLAWKLEVCHDMTFRPHVAPVCDNRHDDFNQPGYPVESKIISKGSMPISSISELMDCWKCQLCGSHM